MQTLRFIKAFVFRSAYSHLVMIVKLTAVGMIYSNITFCFCTMQLQLNFLVCVVVVVISDLVVIAAAVAVILTKCNAKV